MSIEDVIIIGGGPAGLSSGIYTSRAGLSTLIFTGPSTGGQMMLSRVVENYPGLEPSSGSEIVMRMKKQAERFGSQFKDEIVTKVSFSKKPFNIITSRNKGFKAKSVIIATGANAIWLGLESEQRLRGKGVSVCATCDGFFFKGRHVAVVGGGDVAMEEALSLANITSKVYIIHRRDEFRASKVLQKRVFKNKKIEIIWNSEVKEILGKDKVEGVKLELSSKAKETSKKIKDIPNKLEIVGLFIAIGYKPNTSFLTGSGVGIDQKGYVYISKHIALEMCKGTKLKISSDRYNFDYQYQTSVPGVFAAGDVVDNTYGQAATAAGMGVAAALETESFLSK
jgi:thioredoxin reductase (NADPH)